MPHSSMHTEFRRCAQAVCSMFVWHHLTKPSYNALPSSSASDARMMAEAHYRSGTTRAPRD